MLNDSSLDVMNTDFYFMISERELVTPPLNGLILPGITRDSILHLTRQWGDCKVTEATITMQDICKLIQEERVSSQSQFSISMIANFNKFTHIFSCWKCLERELPASSVQLREFSIWVPIC